MKSFKLFNDSKLPDPEYDEVKMYGISLSEISPAFEMPAKYKDPKFVIDLQANCTLCDPTVGLFGRTVVCKSGDPVEPKDLKMHQWIIFMSDIYLNNTYLMCEIIINIYDKSN